MPASPARPAGPSGPARPERPVQRATVVRTEQLTPHLVRVVLAAPAVAPSAFTDAYVKLVLPRPGVGYPQPFDPATARDLPPEQWPVIRTYTVRRWVPAAGELWLDVVVHGDEGFAGPWAVAARPGDVVFFRGPGGAYAPDPAAAWHLLAGDASALPALCAAMEAIPPAAPTFCFVEVDGPAEVPADVPAGITWSHRGAAPVGASLVAAVRALPFPPGRVDAFVHGEATFVRELRRHLRGEREVPREQLSISGYWRLGMNEDGWQSSKREWNAEVEREQEVTA